MTTEFTHLHTHSEHSILDGFTKTVDVPRVIAEQGQSSVALTDHGSLAGALKFWKACKEAEVKGIFGVETYVTPDLTVKDKDSPTWHLVLVAQNRTGLENLFAMSKIGWTNGFYRKPRIDHATLAKHSDGIIALSACMASETSRAIEAGDLNLAGNSLSRYASIFDGRFYVELQPGNSVELNGALYNLADSLGLATVVTVDSHYDYEACKADTELLLIMQQVAGFKQADKDYANLSYHHAERQHGLMTRLNTLWPNRNLRFDKHDLHLMSRDEVVRRMNEQGFDGNALADATLEIADRCEQVDFKTGLTYLPKVASGRDSDEYLRELVYEGLRQRGKADDQVYVARIEEELAILRDKNFADYFLIVADIIAEARRRNIYVGPGRGSAAGSLVAYCLRITSIDPIKYKLLFFRFIRGFEVKYNPVFNIIHE